MRILILITISISASAASFAAGNVSESDTDVLILSMLIQDHFRRTNGREITLSALIKGDPYNRISERFERIELNLKGGHISVYYKFSATRQLKEIELLDNEKERTKYFRWTERKIKGGYDGEIRLDYGERFYRIIRIISKPESRLPGHCAYRPKR